VAGGADNYDRVWLTATAGIMVGGGGGKIESESDQVHCVAGNFAGIDGGGHFFLAGVANRSFTFSDNYVIYLFRYFPTPLFAKIIYQNGVGVLNSGPGCLDHHVTYRRIGMKRTRKWRVVVTAEKARYVPYQDYDGSAEVPTFDQLPPPEESEMPPYMFGKRPETLEEVKAKIIVNGGPKPTPGATED